MYRGFLRCGHLNWLAVDLRDPEDAVSLSEDVAHVIRHGGWVDRVTLDEARGSAFGCPDDCPLSHKNRSVGSPIKRSESQDDQDDQ